MDSRRWLRYFETNRHRHATQVPGDIPIDEPMRSALVRSLQRFERGETGEGRIVSECRQSGDPALDETLCDAMALYIREEGGHAAVLRKLVRALGGEPLERTGSEVLFRRARRLFGLRTKLLALAAAEVVGLVFYELVRDRVPSEAMARAVGEIARDEVAHIDFQAELFARMVAQAPALLRPLEAAALFGTFSFILVAGIVTVAIDQRPFFVAAGVRWTTFASLCWREVRCRLDVGGGTTGAATASSSKS